MNQDEERQQLQLSEKAWSQAVARIWLGDDAFKAELIKNPRAILEGLGAKIPQGAAVKIIENTTDQLTFVLPLKPKSLGHLTAGDVVEMYGTCPCTVCSVPTSKI